MGEPAARGRWPGPDRGLGYSPPLMTEVVDFVPHRRRAAAPRSRPPTRRPTFFSRHELAQILSVYSRKVIAGEWRDYAIEIDEDGTAFAIYARAADNAAYRISKSANGGGGRYRVTTGRHILGCGGRLGSVLSVFGGRHLRLIERN